MPEPESVAILDDAPVLDFKLGRDLRKAARTLSAQEARYLVDSYYQLQAYRLVCANQTRALSASTEPHELVGWLAGKMKTLEGQIISALNVYTDANRLGEWCKSIVGIGPVIAAGLLAHINLDKVNSAAQIWSFAGLNPNQRWEGAEAIRGFMAGKKEAGVSDVGAFVAACDWIGAKPLNVIGRVKSKGDEPFLAWETAVAACNAEGLPQPEAAPLLGGADELIHRRAGEDREPVYARIVRDAKIKVPALVTELSRRPWNADLKTLCWKLGESFVITQPCKDSFYGPLFAKHKESLIARNESGGFKDNAARALSEKNYVRDTKAKSEYQSGRLPPAHVHAMARRWVVKLFLSHFFEVGTTMAGRQPVRPYVIDILGHKDYIPPPNWP